MIRTQRAWLRSKGVETGKAGRKPHRGMPKSSKQNVTNRVAFQHESLFTLMFVNVAKNKSRNANTRNVTFENSIQ